MPWRVLVSAMAIGLATPTETRGQKAGAQVLDVGQAGRELITFIPECLQGSSHGASYLTGIINCQIKKENPTQTLSDFRAYFQVVRPLPLSLFEISGGTTKIYSQNRPS